MTYLPIYKEAGFLDCMTCTGYPVKTEMNDANMLIIITASKRALGHFSASFYFWLDMHLKAITIYLRSFVRHS